MAKKQPQVKYEIDLIRVMERAMSGKPQAVRSKLRNLMKSRLFKQKFGENVIDRIAHRTEKKRIDKKNKAFIAPYSTMYQKSLDYKIYGKSANIVNLKLTGEMLASMRVGKSGSNTVKIIMADAENNNKAHGHINGIKRRVNQGAKVKFRKGKRIAPAKKKIKRDFLGLPPEDEIKMMKKTITAFNTESLETLIDFDKETLDFNVELATITAETESATGSVEIGAVSSVDTI